MAAALSSALCLMLLAGRGAWALEANLPPPPRPKHAEHPQPTQYALGVLRTNEAVKEGRVPDPALRRPDGTPGTLLDALLPEPRMSDKQEALHRRRLQRASRWRFLGANIPFLQGPTLAALNATFYRYASVYPASTVDWRNSMYMTPVQPQYDCASCWAMSAADAVAIVSAIAENRPAVAPGAQQICDCSGLGCCQGGWPEDAFAWMLTQGNITTNDNYSYYAVDTRQCTLGSSYPLAGKISGWERVPLYSQDALMKAVNMQPVLVYISASAKDFQNYTSDAPGTPGFRIYDGNCTTEVNHAVLVVGYDTTGNTPYWILKNTWMPYALIAGYGMQGWGHNGYMYMVMKDGPGKCGIQTVNPIFPVTYPDAPVEATVTVGSFPVTPYSSYWWNWWSWVGNPCTGVVNPCGSGTCYKDSNNVARCLCPRPYVELVGVPTSKCVDASPCSSSLFGPCGAGWCMDVGDGSYVCGCPAGYAVGSRVGGAPTCVPVATLGIRGRTYSVQHGDTCASIQAAFNISVSSFSSLNPYLQCGPTNSKPLVQNYVVALEPTSGVICTQQYPIRPGDTCGTIAVYMDKTSVFQQYLNPSYWGRQVSLLYNVPYLNGIYGVGYNATNFTRINPTLNCSNLYSSQQVCVSAANVNVTAAPVVCSQTYTTAAWDTCYYVRSLFGLSSYAFARLNPGLNCNYNYGYFYAGVQVCVAQASQAAPNVNCTQWYTVQQGDTCAQIWNAANMSQYQLLFINPGLQCQPPFLYVGLQICIDSPLLSNISDPSFIVYTIQPGDSWSTVQAQFSKSCEAYSITIPRIADQNGIADWVNYTFVPTSVLVIPCVQKIGSPCGCADSLPVCGADSLNYPSYCDARCYFATPVSSGPCTMCQLACAGRYGLAPKPNTTCPEGFTCPWPSWPPPQSDASAVFGSSSPLCKYRFTTCIKACALYNFVNNQGTDSSCFNSCYSCQRVPCSGPSNTQLASLSPCSGDCGTEGCKAFGKNACSMDCNYWNSWWNPINP